jgi:hypothetical protein
MRLLQPGSTKHVRQIINISIPVSRTKIPL